MNSPFVIEQARHSARRLLAESNTLDDASRLDLAYRRALGRSPTEAERGIAAKFLDQRSANNPEDAWTMVFQALFASMNFRYVE